MFHGFSALSPTDNKLLRPNVQGNRDSEIKADAIRRPCFKSRGGRGNFCHVTGGAKNVQGNRDSEIKADAIRWPCLNLMVDAEISVT